MGILRAAQGSEEGGGCAFLLVEAIVFINFVYSKFIYAMCKSSILKWQGTIFKRFIYIISRIGKNT